MNQYWLVENVEDKTDQRLMVFCTAIGREGAKNKGRVSLLGDPDKYVVTPITNPGECVKMQIIIGS